MNDSDAPLVMLKVLKLILVIVYVAGIVFNHETIVMQHPDWTFIHFALVYILWYFAIYTFWSIIRTILAIK